MQMTGLYEKGASCDAHSPLGISTCTAEGHRGEIMKKVKLGSLAGLIRYTIRNEIVQHRICLLVTGSGA